ncbi:MAG: hypothetical protein FWC08_13655 [Defluviitaleaceae bacterium]|nr:hypothetical protein [Defluviitaleaceae bacterium]
MNEYNISQDVMSWLKSVGVMWNEKPLICSIPYRVGNKVELMPYSAEYLKNTPLEEIKRGHEDHVAAVNGRYKK